MNENETARCYKTRDTPRLGPARCRARALDKLAIGVLKRLEAPPSQRENKAAYVILALTAGYLLVRLCAFLI